MIYLFLEDRFEEVEALAPIDILRRAGADLKTVGESGRVVTGAHGVSVTADLLESDVSFENMDMVILPGGPGTSNHEKSSVVRESLLYCEKNNKLIGAICAAPSVLGHLGILRGKKAVCFPGYEAELEGAAVLQEPVCVSQNVITARGAGVAIEFALALTATVFGDKKSEEIRKSIQCM
jgi:4-methyl-5(b-hydroxyethyl)-thiazole monophosphate biosynthesis